MGTVRTFIAVHIPVEIRRRLVDIENQLMASGADVRWVSEGNFHITLKFLGNVDSNQLDAIARAVESAVDGVSSFEVGLSGVGAFPNVKRPSVVWVGIRTGGDELKALAGRVEAALERSGFPPEARAFSPHITVGRVKSPRNSDKLREMIERLRDSDAGSFRVESVAVMRSDLRPSGSVYSEIAKSDLQIEG